MDLHNVVKTCQKDAQCKPSAMEGAGFEPARGVTAEDLKSSPLDHSGNLPNGQVLIVNKILYIEVPVSVEMSGTNIR